MKVFVFPLSTARSLSVRIDDHEAADLDDTAWNRLVVGFNTPVLPTFLTGDLLCLYPVVIDHRPWMRSEGDSVFERSVDNDEMLTVDRANVGTPATQIVAFQTSA